MKYNINKYKCNLLPAHTLYIYIYNYIYVTVATFEKRKTRNETFNFLG